VRQAPRAIRDRKVPKATGGHLEKWKRRLLMARSIFAAMPTGRNLYFRQVVEVAAAAQVAKDRWDHLDHKGL
jgi:hypothetical protein